MSSSRDLEATVKSSKAPAIARAAAVLRLLGKSENPMALQQISRALGLVPSTCLYVLRALVEEELVGYDPSTKRYVLGAGVLTLARHWLERDPFPKLAQPLIQQLAQEFEITALGIEVAGLDHMIVVCVSEATGNYRLSTRVGSRFPALISASGRCLAAFSSIAEDRLRTRFEKLRWDNPPSFDVWREQVALTRDRGYAVDEGNYIAGVTVIAAPIWRTAGAPTNALVATGLSRGLAPDVVPELAGALKTAAATLSLQLSNSG